MLPSNAADPAGRRAAKEPTNVYPHSKWPFWPQSSPGRPARRISDLASVAVAGECPADKVKANVREPVNLPATGVTDTVLATIDLAKEPIKADGRLQRVRKLVIQSGGIVPWHSHDDRPALIYVVEGEINEYNSNCSVPIVHKAGDVARETLGTSHWWKKSRRQDRHAAVVRHPA